MSLVEDATMLMDRLRRLSVDTIRRRFLAARPRPPSTELRYQSDRPSGGLREVLAELAPHADDVHPGTAIAAPVATWTPDVKLARARVD